MEFCRHHIQDNTQEKDLYDIQAAFFQTIANDLSIGEVEEGFNLIECVNKAQFKRLGEFKLIDEKRFGYEYQYYIPRDDKDKEYNKAVEVMQLMYAEKERGYKYAKRYAIALNQQLKKLADRMITIRVFDKDNIPLASNDPEYFDIKVLADPSLYTFERGFNHNSVENAFL